MVFKISRFHYDGRRHITRVVDSRGYTWLYQFNEAGILLAITDPLGGSTRNLIDSADRIVATFDPTDKIQAGYLLEEGARQYIHIGRGDVRTRVEFNDQGEVIAVTDAFDNRWEQLPDGRGGYSQVKSPLGYLWRMERTATDLRVVEPDGETTVYQTLDDGGRMMVTDPLGDRENITLTLDD